MKPSKDCVFYLAARYSRREELCTYRKELQRLGYKVQCRWLDGKRQISGDSNVKNASLRAKFAFDDFEDVMSSHCVINFTEPPRSGHSRDGRHIEFGLALANDAFVVVIGHRDNIFHWLPEVSFYSDWESFKREVL